MKIKVKSVYYCEFCKKHRLSKHPMIQHERRCTLNPKRECGLCEKFNTKPRECPICEFSKLRLSGDSTAMHDFDLAAKMKQFFEDYNTKQDQLEAMNPW